MGMLTGLFGLALIALAGIGFGGGVLAVLILIPAYRLAERVGYPGWYAFLLLIPILNLVLLWMFAFKPWPKDQGVLNAHS